MRIATWNVNSVTARLPRLLQWLELTRPDVLCIQETKVADDQFPAEPISALGYEVAVHGSGRWNGVGILSRVGLRDVCRGCVGEPGFPEPEARAVSATCGGVRVWSVYVPNGREVGAPAFAFKLQWLAALTETLRREAASHDLAVCGDFNVAPTDDDVWDPAAFVGSTHVTAEERAAVAGLTSLGLVDVQPRAFKGRPFTYWDYRAGNFHKGMGMRIDLVLLSQGLARRIEDAYIDRDARKGTLPSDHAPVVVDIGDGEASA
ncbi:MAG TPA: exodeoxyribonuclease III [Chloroflexota bacterium]|nr:exodeoxyribonuclease III [Chloroflexota bacterium]